MVNINLEVPVNSEDLAKLLEAVPLEWYSIEATLRPDIELIKTGRILPNTGFGIISSHFAYGSGYPVFFHVEDVAFEDAIGGDGPKRLRIKPKTNLAEIALGNKLPSSIEFIRAGGSSGEFQRAREISINAIRLEYKGYLSFYKYEASLDTGLSLNQLIQNPFQNSTICCLLAERVAEGNLDLKDALDAETKRLEEARKRGYETTETLSVFYDRRGKYEDILPIINRAIELGINILKQ
ncbi:MAG: hypothetical protein Q8N99_02290 [Nanoarchaeota archaeon]|nr:hypothetical protein [Nanoarchaeota archaeon]